MTLLAAREQLAEIDILVELDADQVVPDPDDRARDLLGRQFDIDVIADGGGTADDRHQAAGGEILDPDQLLLAGTIRQLGDAEHGGDSVVVSALHRARHRRRQRHCRRIEFDLTAPVDRNDWLPPDQRLKHKSGLRAEFAPNWDFIASTVKKAFHLLDLRPC